MTKLENQGERNITQGKFRQKWAKLTYDDIQFVLGKQDDLLARAQKRTGVSGDAHDIMLKESRSSCG